jgi:methylase of polypeptide subunit release factors
VPAADRARRLCRRAAHWLYRPFVLSRIARPSEATLLGRRLVTDPEVFHPVYFHSTRILVEDLAAIDLTGRRFLDMGTGSGAIGVLAAARGARVTACDINPRAVALASENLRRNGLAGEVLQSDLFAALGPRTFDVISFNIPFYARPPGSNLESAFFAGDELETVRRFAAGCAAALDAGGVVAIVFSEDSGRGRVLSFFADAGFAPDSERIAHRLFERFHVVRFRRVNQAPT